MSICSTVIRRLTESMYCLQVPKELMRADGTHEDVRFCMHCLFGDSPVAEDATVALWRST